MSCEAIKAGLRLDHPGASDAEIHELLIERVYGERRNTVRTLSVRYLIYSMFWIHGLS
jgi:hypothetical protein